MLLVPCIRTDGSSQVELMLEMYDDIDWMDEPTETGWMPAPEQVGTDSAPLQGGLKWSATA